MNIPMMEEHKTGKVSGEFEDRRSAEMARAALVERANLSEADIRLIAPHDPAFSAKIEPESHGIARTMLKTHYVLGVAGLVIGLIVSGLLVLFGPRLTASSPVMTFIAITTISTFSALLWAGFLALRPDHDPLIMRAGHSARTGRWTVVVHTGNEGDMNEARRILETSSAHSHHTLT